MRTNDDRRRDYGSADWGDSERRRADWRSGPVESPDRSPNPERFRRAPRSESQWLGVCAGLARQFGIDPTWVRLGFFAAMFTPINGPVFIGYIIAAMITERASTEFRRAEQPDERAFWKGVRDRPQATFAGLRYRFADLEDRLQEIERVATSEEFRLRRQFKDIGG